MLELLQQLFHPSPKTRTLYIVRGVSGSGKSSLAEQLSRHNVAADDFPGLYSGGQYQIELQSESHRWCEAQVEGWMQARKPTIAVHNTAMKRKYYQQYLDLAAKYGYTVQVIHA